MHLLLVEDDQILADGISRALRQRAYTVDHSPDGRSAVERLSKTNYDGMILDLCLPGKDGTEILKELRLKGDTTPVLVLTARDTVQDRVNGLNLGADDYITKPFDLDELEARLRAVIRRANAAIACDIVVGALRFDRVGKRLYINEALTELSGREMSVLELLLVNLGRVVPKEIISDRIGTGEKELGANAIEVYVHRIRKKLSPAGVELRTIRGLGYLIEPNE